MTGLSTMTLPLVSALTLGSRRSKRSWRDELVMPFIFPQILRVVLYCQDCKLTLLMSSGNSGRWLEPGGFACRLTGRTELKLRVHSATLLAVGLLVPTATLVLYAHNCLKYDHDACTSNRTLRPHLLTCHRHAARFRSLSPIHWTRR